MNDFSIMLVHARNLLDLKIENEQLLGNYIYPLAMSLRRCYGIGIIALNNCALNDSHVIILSRALSELNQLKIINFSNNKICDNGALALTNAIVAQCELKEIILSNNEIGDKGMIELIKFSKKINSLANFEVKNNRLSYAMGQRLSTWKASAKSINIIHE